MSGSTNYDVIFGGSTAFCTVVTSVSAATKLVLAANTMRKYAILRNMDAAETVYINVGTPGTWGPYGTGFPLKAGEAYEISRVNLTDGAIYATPNAGKSVVISGFEGL